jgi:speckle-type POZ protein
MPRGKLVAVNHVGGEQQEGVVREQVLSETHTIRFVFHDFEKLPYDRDESTKSSASLCHGYTWKLFLYPGGSMMSNSNTVNVSAFLKCVSTQGGDCQVKAKFTFRIPSARYSRAMRGRVFGSDSCQWGHPDLFLRSDVLDPSKGFLVDGNLIIEVDIQVYNDASSFWEPKCELHLDMLGLLESANQSGDVKFQVGPEVFSAHRPILEARAPELAVLTEDYPSETPIHIQDIKSSAFRSLLRFAYANDVPKPEEFQKEARELLNVADRFGCKGLKLLAEAELVESGITVDTAADLVLLGDAKNCALLKEAAMDYFVENPTSVMSSPGWANMRESAALLTELLEVAFSNKKRSAPAASNEARDNKRMCVSALRRRLDEKGLDVDGSREMLVSRLEEEEVA